MSTFVYAPISGLYTKGGTATDDMTASRVELQLQYLG